MIEKIEKVIQLIDKTPHMHGSDPEYIGGERAEYFEWATDQLIKLITKPSISDCGKRTGTTLVKPEDLPFSFAENAWKLYSFHYFISELIQACINQGEWNLLPNILSPSCWKVFDYEPHKDSMFQYLPEDQIVKQRSSWSLEYIIKHPTTWNWGNKFFVEIE
tara:strand:- start:56 stop:541 length:486 start_codon:yes stop_codon:yes gene_type:complete